MFGDCPIPRTGTAFLSGLLNHIDCQAQTIGASGYASLAAPGSTVSVMLTGLLTILIAIFGLRMMWGAAQPIGAIVATALKIGIVLMLATSWAAFRPLVYDVVMHGPAEILAGIGTPSNLPGANGGLVDRLQRVDDNILAFIAVGPGRFEPVLGATGSVEASTARDPVNDDLALSVARTAYLAGTIGSLGFVRLVAGLMLAIAPLMAGLLLFDGTRSLFFGWLKLLIGLAVGALGVTFVLAAELSVVGPWLSDVLALRAARYGAAAAPLELLVLTLAFAAIAVAAVGAAFKLAFNVHVPTSNWDTPRTWGSDFGFGLGRTPAAAAGSATARVERSRAASIADALTAQQRLTIMGSDETRQSSRFNEIGAMTRSSSGLGERIVPLGQQGRATGTRVPRRAVEPGMRR